VNLIGKWKKGFSEPLWVMTNLEAEKGQRIYLSRMKIERSLGDLKSLLGMTKLMNKKQTYMKKMLALLLLVFAIGLLVGECLQDHLYGECIAEMSPSQTQSVFLVGSIGNRANDIRAYSFC
jgi:hypothetical protein